VSTAVSLAVFLVVRLADFYLLTELIVSGKVLVPEFFDAINGWFM
jgi:hypothetical protein